MQGMPEVHTFWMKGGHVQLVLTTLYIAPDYPSVMLGIKSPWITLHSHLTQGCTEKQESTLPAPAEDLVFPHLPRKIAHYNRCVHCAT